jgi:hypothetical protein
MAQHKIHNDDNGKLSPIPEQLSLLSRVFSKCLNDTCNYRHHSNLKNNKEMYCCTGCKLSGNHGPLCERIAYNLNPHSKPTLDIGLRREVVIDTWMGGLGNNIMQLVNALHIGLYYNCDIVMPPHRYLCRKIKIYNPEFDNNKWYNTVIKDVTEKSFKTPYIIHPQVYTTNSERVIELLRDSFIIKGDSIPPLGDNDVVIHIRAGDIFKSVGHPEYYQPPLSFYVNLLNEKKFTNIYLVSEDNLNPCINRLLKLFPSIRYKRNSLDKDIKLVLSAKHVISSNGSFVDQIIKFSNHIQHIYKYENVDYARLMYPWDNTPIKKQIMIVFDEKKPNNGI